MENSSLSRKELYEYLRKQIEHEDHLIKQRITWLLTTQGLLFVGFTSLYTNLQVSNKFVMTVGICIIGFIMSLSLFGAILSAFESFKHLEKTWNHYTRKYVDPHEDDFPQIIGGGRWYHSATGIGGGSPMVFMMMWAGITAFLAWDTHHFLMAIMAIIVVILTPIGILSTLYKVQSGHTSKIE